LLQRGLRIEGYAGFEIHLYLRPLLIKTFQRWRQPLNAAVAFNGDAKRGLVRFVTCLKRPAYLRQNLLGKLQQNFTLRRESQWLTFTNKQAEPKPLLQIAELMGEGRLGLMQRGGGGG